MISLGLLPWLALVAGDVAAQEKTGKLEKIGHIMVIFLENRSFDHLYGFFPGADGIRQAKPGAFLQVDHQGKVFPTLPRVLTTERHPPVPDERFPSTLPNRPFPIDRFVPTGEKTSDLVHRFYQHQAQINGGRMNRFAAVSDAGGLTMGYYQGSKLPLWRYAKQFTLADRFFQAAFGGSFLNHQWLICACTPRHEQAPGELRAVIDGDGKLIKDGAFAPDGYAVNNVLPAHWPHINGVSNKVLPPLTSATIGDRLTEQGIGWAWFAGGWAQAAAGQASEHFQVHHQPFLYYQRYAEGSNDRRMHLRDGAEFLAGIATGKLPAVSFYKPLGEVNEHPGSADLLSGEHHVADILDRIQRSPLWKDSVIVVTYDEYGGFWDHVPPPEIDRWGPGSRVPALIVSPFARRGYVDHTRYDTTSILKLIEDRFQVAPLGERDAKANSLLNALKL